MKTGAEVASQVRCCVVVGYLSTIGPWRCDHKEQQSRGCRHCPCSMRGLKLAGRHDLRCRFDTPETVQAAAGADAGPSARVVRVGMPYQKIANTGETVKRDLIVIATLGRTGFANALLETRLNAWSASC